MTMHKTDRLTLREAIEHSKLIKNLQCPVCGIIMSDSYNRVEMVNAIRGDGYCSSCHFDIYNNDLSIESKLR